MIREALSNLARHAHATSARVSVRVAGNEVVLLVEDGDAIEVEWPHQLLRGLLAGIGEPHLVIRPGPTSFVLRHVTSGTAQSLTRQGARPACPGWPALTFLRQ